MVYNVAITKKHMGPKNGKRNDEIIKNYNNGGTIAGLSLKFGISRQRVHQILKKAGVKMRGRGKPRKERLELKCKHCGKKYESIVKTRTFCSRRCASLGMRKYRTPAERIRAKRERRVRARERASRHYHEVFKKNPQWREIVRIRNLRLRPFSANV